MVTHTTFTVSYKTGGLRMGKTVTRMARRLVNKRRILRITARRAKGTTTAKGKPVRD